MFAIRPFRVISTFALSSFFKSSVQHVWLTITYNSVSGSKSGLAKPAEKKKITIQHVIPAQVLVFHLTLMLLVFAEVLMLLTNE